MLYHLYEERRIPRVALVAHDHVSRCFGSHEDDHGVHDAEGGVSIVPLDPSQTRDTWAWAARPREAPFVRLQTRIDGSTMARDIEEAVFARRPCLRDPPAAGRRPDAEGFLREVSQARKTGYATVSSEHYPGVGAVASPIVDAAGKLIAVVSLGFAVGQVAPQKVAALGRKIQDAAREIARRQAQDETRWSATQPRRKAAAGKT